MTRAAGIREVAVVIPVNDEEETLADCLDSVLAAIRAATSTALARGERLRGRVVVVLDGCTDASSGIAHAVRASASTGDAPVPVDVLAAAHRSVGAVRALGVSHALGRRGVVPAELWIANTDADGVVPPSWLGAHLAAARRGADVVVGGVALELDALDPLRRRGWLETGAGEAASTGAGAGVGAGVGAGLGDGGVGGGVHGANLGVRGSWYERVGGFEPVAEHEDVRLVARLRGAGARVEIVSEHPVRTSARLVGRTPGGFAGFLTALGETATA